MKQKLRKQVSIDFLNYAKTSINDMLQSKIPQFAKQKLCIIMEKLLIETKSDKGFKYLYWNRFGKFDWEEAKNKAVYKDIPKEYLYGQDDTGKLDFISDIQGEFSRHYQ
jgi:hypothetical protein